MVMSVSLTHMKKLMQEIIQDVVNTVMYMSTYILFLAALTVQGFTKNGYICLSVYPWHIMAYLETSYISSSKILPFL